MTLIKAIALITSGVLVGFINTLAGGGTIITVSLLIFLGLPASVANGTNRVAVLFQTMVAVFNFNKNHAINLKKDIVFCIPTVIGSVIGSNIAANLNESIIEKTIAVVMFIMLFFIVYKPEKWLKKQQDLIQRPLRWHDHLVYFLIGIYGGFIHIGVGFFMIAALVLKSGYDLLHANAIKNLLVLAYAPFSLLIFLIYGQIDWLYGLVLSIGNVMGAYIASKYAFKWGANFVRWIIIIVIIITVLHLLDIIDFKMIFRLFV